MLSIRFKSVSIWQLLNKSLLVKFEGDVLKKEAKILKNKILYKIFHIYRPKNPLFPLNQWYLLRYRQKIVISKWFNKKFYSSKCWCFRKYGQAPIFEVISKNALLLEMLIFRVIWNMDIKLLLQNDLKLRPLSRMLIFSEIHVFKIKN